MQSLIIRYIDFDNQENLTIGSIENVDKIIKTNTKQIIELMSREHTGEQRDKMKALNAQQLYDLLTNALEENHLYNIRPN